MNFVRPGYFDSLSSFKRTYQEPILAGKVEGASREAIGLHDIALRALQSKLSSIMLQRSHDNIVKSSMPEKSVFFIACRMTPIQRDIYDSEADRVLRCCDGATALSDSTLHDEDACPPSSANILSGLQKLRLIANIPISTSLDAILSSSTKFKVCRQYL